MAETEAAADAQVNTDAGNATDTGAAETTIETGDTDKGKNFIADAGEETGGEQQLDTDTGKADETAITDKGKNFLDDDQDEESEAETKEGDETEEGAEVEGVPEAYEFKMPEGMEEDTALTAAISPILKEAGVTQEAAQKLSDAFAAQQQVKADASAQAFKDFEAKETQEMREAVKALPDYKNVVLNAKAAMDFMAQNDEEKAYLKEDGNNPTFLKMMARLGSQIGEGKFVEGDSGGGGEPTEAQKLDQAYPTM